MTIQEIILEAKKQLIEKKIEDEHTIVVQLLCHVLQQDRQYIIVHQEDQISVKEYDDFQKLINSILDGIPLQYLTGHQEFMGLDFLVNEHVLIPQPDTEVVVQNCLAICQKLLKTKSKISVLDLCTGSGAIAISIDKHLPTNIQKKVTGSDISTEALAVAKQNQQIHQTSIQWIQSDLFQSIFEKFDIIVSNPPYIETDQIQLLSKDVQAEPHIALDGGKDGLEFYRKIAKEAINYLNSEGYLCLEIGYQQAEAVNDILQNNQYCQIQITKDYTGNDRCIICQKK